MKVAALAALICSSRFRLKLESVIGKIMFRQRAIMTAAVRRCRNRAHIKQGIKLSGRHTDTAQRKPHRALDANGNGVLVTVKQPIASTSLCIRPMPANSRNSSRC